MKDTYYNKNDEDYNNMVAPAIHKRGGDVEPYFSSRAAE
jgi:hypothetical protein